MICGVKSKIIKELDCHDYKVWFSPKPMCSNESKPLEVIQIIKYNWLKINVMKIKLERQENGTEKRIEDEN